MLCKVLKINESGYYRWLKNRDKLSSRQLLLVEIQSIVNKHPDNDNYGINRIQIALEQKTSSAVAEPYTGQCRKAICFIMFGNLTE